MRPLEILVTGALLVALVGRLIPGIRNRRTITLMPLVAGLLIPVQMAIEGCRWQMVPMYAISGVFFMVSLLPAYRRSDGKFFVRIRLLRIMLNTLLFLLFFSALLFPLLLPVVDLPAPSGPYTVGKRSFHMIDADRKELFTADPEDTRNLLVTVWYPAEKMAGITRDRYWDRKGVTGRAYSLNAGMGTFWYSHLSLVKTNSYPGAPLSPDQKNYPVILYSHSFYGLNTENTMLAEELASQGYLFVSIAHTYENIVSVFPNGEFTTGNLGHISQEYDSNAEQEKALYEQYKAASGKDQKISLTRQILTVDELSTRMLKIRTGDAIFVLDQLELLNHTDTLLQDKLDLNSVGIMGWSFGGATSMEACLADRRFKAAVNMDGTPYGEIFNTGQTIAQPLMLIRSEDDDEMEGIIGNLVMDQTGGDAYMLTVEDALHANFWDFPLFFGIYKRLGYWGTIDPLRLLEIEKAFIRGFFDRYLKGIPVKLKENGTELFPEVTFTVQRN
jgi:predicted dienelactone hydrolase